MNDEIKASIDNDKAIIEKKAELTHGEKIKLGREKKKREAAEAQAKAEAKEVNDKVQSSVFEETEIAWSHIHGANRQTGEPIVKAGKYKIIDLIVKLDKAFYGKSITYKIDKEDLCITFAGPSGYRDCCTLVQPIEKVIRVANKVPTSNNGGIIGKGEY